MASCNLFYSLHITGYLIELEHSFRRIGRGDFPIWLRYVTRTAFKNRKTFMWNSNVLFALKTISSSNVDWSFPQCIVSIFDVTDCVCEIIHDQKCVSVGANLVCAVLIEHFMSWQSDWIVHKLMKSSTYKCSIHI